MEKSKINNIVILMAIICCLSIISSCKKDKPPPSNVGIFNEAVQSHLLVVKNEVASIIDSTTNQPVTIPDFDFIYDAAANIESNNNPPKYLASLYSLLGRAMDVDCEVPNQNGNLIFPKDHHLYPKMGFEWYYLGILLDAVDLDGTSGRIGIVLSMQKQRVIGLTTQEKYALSDNDCMFFTNQVTATVDFSDHKKITRRNENLQLPALGGNASYSSIGEDFYFNCGTDNFSGSMDVLPLKLNVNDGGNLSFSLTFIPPNGMNPDDAFFLQGIPDATLVGTGYTEAPTPGIYYSWPQLQIDTSLLNTITVEGKAYTITGGGGWMDHQLMMHSLKNADNQLHPIPFIEEVKPYNGWSWQFFNLENGDAYTAASFQVGNISPSVAINYGYYINPSIDSTKWESKYIMGNMTLNNFLGHPVIVDDPSSPLVMFPSNWEYENIQSVDLLLAGQATPWLNDGTFNGQSFQIISENPVDYIDTSGENNNGVGFCESVGFEQVDTYRTRIMEYLNSQN